LGPHRTRWAALSDGDDPKKIETTFCIGSRHPPPLWAWDTIRHRAPDYIRRGGEGTGGEGTGDDNFPR